MKHMHFCVILLAVLLVSCTNPMAQTESEEGFNPVHLTVGVPYRDKIIVEGQNYYEFTTGIAGSYAIALTDVDSWLEMSLYRHADFSGLVAWVPEGRGGVTMSVALDSATGYYLSVTETALFSAPDVLIETDSFQLLITGP
jgi:hypothetical protein